MLYDVGGSLIYFLKLELKQSKNYATADEKELIQKICSLIEEETEIKLNI